MTWGRLEHEVRLLPHVLSCSTAQDDTFVVLASPSADPEDVQRQVSAVMARLGLSLDLRILGGSVGVARSIEPRRLGRRALLATTMSVGVLAVGALAASVSLNEPPSAGRIPTVLAHGAPFDQDLPAPRSPGRAPAGPITVSEPSEPATSDPIRHRTDSDPSPLPVKVSRPTQRPSSLPTPDPESVDPPDTATTDGDCNHGRHYGWDRGHHYGWTRGKDAHSQAAWSRRACDSP